MPALLERILAPKAGEFAPLGRSMSFNDYLGLVTSFQFNGLTYSAGDSSKPGGDFEALVQQVHSENNVVAAAVATRGLLLKQLRFAWRNQIRGDANYRQLFGDQRLAKLERPDPGAMTSPQMLATMEYHESYGGSSFVLDHGDRLEVAAPDLVDVVIAGAGDPDVVVRRKAGRKTGYLYWRNGRDNGPPEPWGLEEVIHWAPEPDPLSWWTGKSWVGSVLAEVVTDRNASKYLGQFFGNAATPNMLVTPSETLTPDQIDEYREIFERKTAGTGNAGRTLWLGGGSKAQVVGSSIADLDLRNITGGAESRIAMRARIPAVILGIRESLAGSSLNAGNYNSARRQLADGWFTPSVIDLCASLETTMQPKAGEELWYDPADVLFLQEDAKDAAEIMQSQAGAIRTLVDGGYTPDIAVAAVRDGNLSKLVGGHTGLTSVQLLQPQTNPPPKDTTDE